MIAITFSLYTKNGEKIPFNVYSRSLGLCGGVWRSENENQEKDRTLIKAIRFSIPEKKTL